MKKRLYVLFLIPVLLLIVGCGKSNQEEILTENMKKMELTGNLVTYQAYYHNVIEYDKERGTGIMEIFQENRRLFAEYTGTIKLGIDLSSVKINVKGNTINVFIPKAMVIGEPNVDKDDFKAESFIESQDGILFKNPITADDSSKAFDKAQQEMKEKAANDSALLSLAQKRAKIVIEENIIQLSGLSSRKYNIEWEYEQ